MKDADLNCVFFHFLFCSATEPGAKSQEPRAKNQDRDEENRIQNPRSKIQDIKAGNISYMITCKNSRLNPRHFVWYMTAKF
jgi:hypothetical protein